jgi:hypothetical protein
MDRGTVVGTAILLAAYLAWGGVIYAKAVPPGAETAIIFVPALAGFAASWFAPSRRLAPTVLLAVPAALFGGVLNLTLQMAGSDVGFYSGLLGALRVAGFTLLSAGLFCAVGGLLAVIARQATGRA